MSALILRQWFKINFYNSYLLETEITDIFDIHNIYENVYTILNFLMLAHLFHITFKTSLNVPYFPNLFNVYYVSDPW